ncbi:hypothetical protein B0I31_10712 [Saccharothrix carnea]|uniref:Uncharacterized protein n=1 Tax=Saccharothrix carnea TaxID=1280637 RepID=A0A2P8I663_SACCR|nr:hypothetical protein B0I31_10712 [Saccharothrix carnea]
MYGNTVTAPRLKRDGTPNHPTCPPTPPTRPPTNPPTRLPTRPPAPLTHLPACPTRLPRPPTRLAAPSRRAGHPTPRPRLAHNPRPAWPHDPLPTHDPLAPGTHWLPPPTSPRALPTRPARPGAVQPRPSTPPLRSRPSTPPPLRPRRPGPPRRPAAAAPRRPAPLLPTAPPLTPEPWPRRQSPRWLSPQPPGRGAHRAAADRSVALHARRLSTGHRPHPAAWESVRPARVRTHNRVTSRSARPTPGSGGSGTAAAAGRRARYDTRTPAAAPPRHCDARPCDGCQRCRTAAAAPSRLATARTRRKAERVVGLGHEFAGVPAGLRMGVIRCSSRT